MVAIGAVPAVFLLIASVFYMKESPVWLEKNTVAIQTEEDPLLGRKPSMAALLSDLFCNPKCRKPLLVCFVLTIVLQLTGVNAIIYYGPKIFTSSGATVNQAFLAEIGVGAWNFVTTLVAVFVVDKYGRRPLYLISLAIMCVATVLMGFDYLLLTSHPTALTGVAIVAVFLFIAGFEAGPGPLFFVIVNESFPNEIQELATALMNLLQWGFTLVISLTFLLVVDVIGLPATYFIFSGVGIVGFVILVKFLPETKGERRGIN